MLDRIIRSFAPIVALAAAFAVGGCDANVTVDGSKGVPLAELDTQGKLPNGIVLAGPDTVVVAQGDALQIETSGDPDVVAALRFTLSDETLGVMRAKDSGRIEGKARVLVTLPALEKIVLAGSGTIEAPKLSGAAEVTIAGSGTAQTAAVEADTLEVTIAGSGTYRAAGKVPKLDLTIAGSGEGAMSGLEANEAEVTIAGSGSAGFASNGTVKATVLGSGEVTVAGTARCTIKSMGSGTLNCTNGTTTQSSAGDAPPSAPTPPAPPAPEAPKTPE